MRITLVLGLASRNAGGLFETVPGLAQALLDCGAQVNGIGIYDAAFEADQGRWPCQIQALKTAPWAPQKLLYAPAMLRELSAANPDIVFCHGLWGYHNRVVLQWARQTRRPYLIIPHGMLDMVDLNKSKLKKWFARKWYVDELFAGAACFRAISESEADSIRTYGVRSPIGLIPNGVFLPAESKVEPPAWRQALPANAKVLFYIGRINPKKGLPSLLEAWRQAAKDSPAGAGGWHLVIAGWDQNQHEETLKAQVALYSMNDTVHFVGPLFGAAKDAAFRYSNALILPSKSEGLPNVVLEAWSYRLPVLMTPQCNLPEGFAARAAVRVETNPSSIAAGLEKLFKMSERELGEMGANGKVLASTKFSWKTAGAAVLAVCNWALGPGPKPSSVLSD